MRQLIVFLICHAMGGVAAAQEPPAAPAGPPARVPSAPQPLAINIDRAISEVVARMLAIPRFEERIEVHDRYQDAIDAYLRGADLACGASASRPAAPDQTRRVGGVETAATPTADLLAAGKLLAEKVKGLFGKKTPHFFLYSVRRQDTATRVVYVVRDGRISEAEAVAIPGMSWELVDSFADRDRAAEALTRLQRGSSPIAGQDAPGTLWAATGCSR